MTAGDRGTARRGAIGLAATGTSFGLTVIVAALGPSIMEPALPGSPGQPPWALTVGPSPYLAVALAASAILAGLTGLTLCLNALRSGWRPEPRLILAAGIIVALALAFLPPFGSSDHLSYAAYGRMALTGHDPYTTTPAQLARLGDPVARAVQDWKHSPSVYGSAAMALQAFASWVGGTSVRLTVFVLSLLNVIAFIVTGVLLHWLGRGDRDRQVRAALLWTANPLLLAVLVAGAHVDSQAIVAGVGAVAVAASAWRAGQSGAGAGRLALLAAFAGALVGVGFAIKVTTALVGAGLAIAFLLPARPVPANPVPANPVPVNPVPVNPVPVNPVPAGQGWVPGVRQLAAVLGGLAGGFCVIVAVALVPWGTGMFGPAIRAGSYTSIGSPWRLARSLLELALRDNAAESIVKAGALLLALGLLALLLRRAAYCYADGVSDQKLAACGFAVVFAWLLAWPYVLPWYDGLGWALLALLPASRLDWLLLARTGALAIGYLPARGIVLPTGLTWLETVVRTAITPAVLLAVIALAISWLWRSGRDLQVRA